MRQVCESRQERRARERNQKKGTVSNTVNTDSPRLRNRALAPLMLSVLFGMIISLLGVKLFFNSSKLDERPSADGTHKVSTKVSLKGKTYAHLLDLTPEEVSAFDVEELNLLCGSNLRGTKNVDIAMCLDRLNHLTEMARAETQRNWSRWQQNPAEYQNSEAFYKMGMVISVVRQDYQAQYNPKLITIPSKESRTNDEFFREGSDIFLQGLLSDRKMGTCASMPVLYVSIGRRLGYPVHLVATKGHLFCRWDDGKERMNFEGTGEGINTYPDSHYQEWPFTVTDQEVKQSTYLINLNRQQELAMFLSNRAECLVVSGRNEEGLIAVAQALRLVSRNGGLTGIIPQLAIRPLIPSNVFNMRFNRNRDPLADFTPRVPQRNQNNTFGGVPIPPDPSPTNQINPFLPKPPQSP